MFPNNGGKQCVVRMSEYSKALGENNTKKRRNDNYVAMMLKKACRCSGAAVQASG